MRISCLIYTSFLNKCIKQGLPLFHMFACDCMKLTCMMLQLYTRSFILTILYATWSIAMWLVLCLYKHVQLIYVVHL
jgi:hypothetical protein